MGASMGKMFGGRSRSPSPESSSKRATRNSVPERPSSKEGDTGGRSWSPFGKKRDSHSPDGRDGNDGKGKEKGGSGASTKGKGKSWSPFSKKKAEVVKRAPRIINSHAKQVEVPLESHPQQC